MIENIFIITAVFLAFFIKRIAGFGNALILNSLLAYVKQTQFTAAIDIILVFPINLYMVWKERKGIKFNTTLPLLFSTLLGSTVGIVLLNRSYDKILKICLGLVIIILAIKLIFKDNKIKQSSPIKNFFFSFFSGLLLGLYGIAALLAVQIQNIFQDKEKYRSNLCLILAIENIYRIAVYISNGILNKTIFMQSIFLFPIVIIAVILASLIDKKINAELIKKIVISLLLISGIIIFIMNLF